MSWVACNILISRLENNYLYSGLRALSTVAWNIVCLITNGSSPIRSKISFINQLS